MKIRDTWQIAEAGGFWSEQAVLGGSGNRRSRGAWSPHARAQLSHPHPGAFRTEMNTAPTNVGGNVLL